MFKVKTKSYGSFGRCKAHLVPTGFHQILGINFHETFSLVVKVSTIRIILALAVSKGWFVRQLDVNNAFLNGKLNEAVYMKPPDGYIDVVHPKYVCKLDHAL